MWWALHKCIVVTVLRTWLSHLRPGDVVLDWGSGCGHKLSWANRLFGVRGVGVELVQATAVWARRNGVGTFCHADGRNLEWVPDGSLKAVISFAALYHLHGSEQCEVVGQLVQKLEVGGRAWLGWMAPYPHYTSILRAQGYLQDFEARCPDDAPPAPGWAAVCAEGLKHMVPPQPTWASCFRRLRRGSWRNLGVDAKFHWRGDLQAFVDPRDQAGVQRRYPQDLPGYSLFIERVAPPRQQPQPTPVDQRSPPPGPLFNVGLPKVRKSLRSLHRGARLRQLLSCMPALERLSLDFYDKGLTVRGLRRKVRSMLRQDHSIQRCLHVLPQLLLLSTDFMLTDRLRALDLGPVDRAHECAMPVLTHFLRYHEARHGLVDLVDSVAERSAHNTTAVLLRPTAVGRAAAKQWRRLSQLLVAGERRVTLGFQTLWARLLDSSKSWGASVGSLGFCDCSTESRVQLEKVIKVIGLTKADFPDRLADVTSKESELTRKIHGCDEIWGFDKAMTAEDRLRMFTKQDAKARSRCAPLAAAFVTLCAQHYVSLAQPLKARDALQAASLMSLLSGDCAGWAEPPLRSVDILHNYARAQRLAQHVVDGHVPFHVMAWQASGLVGGEVAAAVGMGAPPLDDSVPRNFPGGTQAWAAAGAPAAAGASWVCDLAACKEELPQSLARLVQSRDPEAEKLAEAAALRLKVVGPRSECHRFTDDDVRFFEQRIEALALSTARQRCEQQQMPQLSEWRADGTFVVWAPASASWELSTLVPLPWSTLHLLDKARYEALRAKWPQASSEHKGPGALNISSWAADVHGLEVRIAGLDATGCTARTEVHVRAHRLGSDLLQARALNRVGLDEGKLLSVVVVVLDSTPAASWDIFCPELMKELLRASGAGAQTSHESFRFHGYHALLDPECDCLTQDNMMTLFGGHRPPRASAQSRRVAGSSKQFREALKHWRFLWQDMQAAGYVTLSADDSCSRSPLNVADPSYDFFDAYAPTLTADTRGCFQEVFCRHRELLAYTAQWLDVHGELPRLAYLHLDGTHGTRPEQLVRYDTPLATWVAELLSAPWGERTAVVLMSDHGVQSGDGTLTAQPFLTAWIPRWLLGALGPDAAEALRINSRRLLTPFDAHLTLKQLFQASLSLAKGDAPQLVAQKKPDVPGPVGQDPADHVIRSALWALPARRSCSDAGLTLCFCSREAAAWRAPSRTVHPRALAEALVALLNARARSTLLDAKADLSVCRLQSLARVEAVRERSDGGLVEIIVSTEPLGLIWKGVARPDGSKAGSNESKVSSLEQITRYFPHEHCTPAGVDPKYCVCNMNVVHRLAPEDRFWTHWPS